MTADGATGPDVAAPFDATSSNVEQLAAALAPMIAEHVADACLPRIVDAAGLAEYLHVSRDVIYANADRLGAIRLGDGERPRLRFVLDAEAVRSWTARSDGGKSQARDPARSAGARRSTARPSGKSPDLLPIGPTERSRRAA